MGRNPKPIELKKLEGTFRKDRNNNNLPSYPIIIEPPPPPERLPEEAGGLWGDVCEKLIANNLLQSVDLELVAAYCIELHLYWECKKALNDGSLYYTTKAGVKRVKPEIQIANNAFKNIIKITEKFGLSPVDRQKIVAIDPQKKKDGIGDLL